MNNLNFNESEFRKLSIEKLNFLKELSQDIENMPSTNSINYLLTLTNKLKASNIHFSDSEMDLIYSILTNKMTAKEQEKFILLKNLLSKHS